MLTFVMARDPAGFRITEDNRAELRGTVEVPPEKRGAGLGLTIFTLPEGFRPASEMQFEVDTERGRSIVTIAPDGSVLADPKDGWVSLNGISFPVAD
jgi:hypothetical protein